MDRKVNVSDLEVGMYVSNLDRPWIDTPFLLEGFLIKMEEDVFTLTQYCSYVYIDTNHGIGASQYMDEISHLNSSVYLENYLQNNRKNIHYKNTKTAKEELPAAQIALDNAIDQVAHILDDIKQGKSLNIKIVRSIVEPILDSVLRNSEAFMWLMMMQKKSVYTYSHSIENCALAIAFGRYMGLPKSDLRTLAIGLLMMDIGYVRVPEPILNKKGKLTEDEYSIIKKHVSYGVQILKSTKGIDKDVIDVVQNHHERFDGSGYPDALQEIQIPVYGRMAAIIDCYNSMVHSNSSNSSNSDKSAYKALQNIYDWRASAFQPELVEQFLQCMGVYPTGSLIEMESGEVGVVFAQNPTQRMRPKIMLILDMDKEHLMEYKMIDLTEQYKDSSGYQLNIHRGLEPGSYGINATEYYL